MRRILPLLPVLCLAFAPAPFPRRVREAAPAMAGAWDVNWGGSRVRLDLRPDGSARFAYVSGGGAWDGSWKYDGARRLTLTLVLAQPTDYHLTFDSVAANAAGGRVRQGPSWNQPVKLTRSGRK